MGHRVKPYRLLRFVDAILRGTYKNYYRVNVNVSLDEEGFCNIDELVTAINSTPLWSSVHSQHIRELANYSKYGFTYKEDKIKANMDAYKVNAR